jgi:hypothetical protein
MSLQALKLKSNTINSNQSKDGFSLSGGARTTSYIGKSMRNSPNGTRFKGIYPVNFSQTTGVISGSTMCDQITELRGNAPSQQKSVGNNKSMIYSRNKWINTGVYPNVWVQPVKEMGYEEYMKHRVLQEDCEDGKNIPTEGGEDCCACEDAFEKSDVEIYYRPIDKLKRCNDGVVQDMTSHSTSSSLHTLRLQKKCVDPTGSNKPFPYYTTNPGVLNTRLVSCGAISSELNIDM